MPLLLYLQSRSRVINQCDLFYVLPALVSRTLAPTRALPQAVMRAWKTIAFAKTLTRYSIIPYSNTRPIWVTQFSMTVVMQTVRSVQVTRESLIWPQRHWRVLAVVPCKV